MGQEGFQEVRTGRGFVLTKYEPVNSHGVPIRDHFRSKWDPFLMQIPQKSSFLWDCGVGSRFSSKMIPEHGPQTAVIWYIWYMLYMVYLVYMVYMVYLVYTVYMV